MIVETHEIHDSDGVPARRRFLLYMPSGIRFHASSKLSEGEKTITSATAWETLGGVVTNPSFFVENLASAFGRVVCGVKVSGAGAELRLVERDMADDTEVVASPVQALADTAGAWIALKFSTNVPPRVGDMEYRLEGRLGGASLAAVRFASVSLLEIFE